MIEGLINNEGIEFQSYEKSQDDMLIINNRAYEPTFQEILFSETYDAVCRLFKGNTSTYCKLLTGFVSLETGFFDEKLDSIKGWCQKSGKKDEFDEFKAIAKEPEFLTCLEKARLRAMSTIGLPKYLYAKNTFEYRYCLANDLANNHGAIRGGTLPRLHIKRINQLMAGLLEKSNKLNVDLFKQLGKASEIAMARSSRRRLAAGVLTSGLGVDAEQAMLVAQAYELLPQSPIQVIC